MHYIIIVIIIIITIIIIVIIYIIMIIVILAETDKCECHDFVYASYFRCHSCCYRATKAHKELKEKTEIKDQRYVLLSHSYIWYNCSRNTCLILRKAIICCYMFLFFLNSFHLAF